MKKPTKKGKEVMAWAVIQPDMQESMPLAKIFNPSLKHFSEAIFWHKHYAKKYADMCNQFNLKLKVVPCIISYRLPRKTKK